ncbi:MAG: biotin/lipoyl-containing protein [Bacilli bacterium]|jgi:glutaconyl-CoA/methylmalonyl-CoA decarboxylase subunit gamma
MKKYNVKVNGKLYEVELESVESVNGSVSAPTKPATNSVAPVAATAPVGGKSVLAPIGGNVVKVNVKVGDAVKKGQTLVVIEAMKLENEVVAPVDGTVTSVSVSKGNSVNTKDLLVVIG